MTSLRPQLRSATLISPSLRFAAGGAFVVAILVGSGWAATAGYSSRIFALVAAVALCALATFQRGAFVGLLVLATMNGVPFIDTSRQVAAHITIQDVASLTIAAAAIAWIIAASGAHRVTPVARVVSYCGLAIVIWCGFTVARTVLERHATTLGAIKFGRDFLYFGVLLTLLPRVRLRQRDLQTLLAILLAGVCLFSVGQIFTVLGIAHVSWLVHAGATAQTLGLTRVYAAMNDLLFAGIATGIAALVLARGRIRSAAIPITLLLTVSQVVQLTRARWIGLIAGFLVVSLWLAGTSERRVASVLRRRLARLGVALVSIGAAALTAAPSAVTTGPFVTRFTSIFTDVGSATSTVAVRARVDSILAAMLAGKWALGLGLIPPAAHFYLALPNGSLRDPDVGVMNAIVTIGVIGTILLYIPVVVVLFLCMRRRSPNENLDYQWLAYGGAIFIVATIVSSITLGTLFSGGGLVMTAVILTVLCNPHVSGQREFLGGHGSVSTPAFRDTQR
jgi:hypothetical protein